MIPTDTEGLERLLTRARIYSIMMVPLCLLLAFGFMRDEGWRWSLLPMFVLPPIGAYLGWVAKRDIRGGMALLAIVLSVVSLVLTGAIEAL